MGGRRRAAVLLAVVAVVAVAGCGAGGPAAPAAPAAPVAPPSPSRTPQELVVDWTGTVCGALVPVLGHLTAPPRFDVNAPAATRQAYSAYLDAAIAETDRARAIIIAAGPA